MSVCSDVGCLDGVDCRLESSMAWYGWVKPRPCCLGLLLAVRNRGKPVSSSVLTRLLKAEEQRELDGKQQDSRNDRNDEPERSEHDHPSPDHGQANPLPQGSSFLHRFSIGAVHRHRLLRRRNFVLIKAPADTAKVSSRAHSCIAEDQCQITNLM